MRDLLSASPTIRVDALRSVSGELDPRYFTRINGHLFIFHTGVCNNQMMLLRRNRLLMVRPLSFKLLTCSLSSIVCLAFMQSRRVSASTREREHVPICTHTHNMHIHSLSKRVHILYTHTNTGTPVYIAYSHLCVYKLYSNTSGTPHTSHSHRIRHPRGHWSLR